jgi:hypothetical protein
VTAWLRASTCPNAATCVEVADIGRAMVLRSGRHPDHIALIDYDAWAAFLAAVRAGEFDQPRHDNEGATGD